MATYYLHYGFDWNSYPIGQVWGTQLGEAEPDESLTGSQTYYWLQYALTTNAQATSQSPWAPALFNFQSGDTLQFVIWDLTQWTSQRPSLTLYAYLALNELDGTQFTSPFTTSGDMYQAQDDPYYTIPVDVHYPVSTDLSDSVTPNSPMGPASGATGVLGTLVMTSDKEGGFIMNFCVQITSSSGEQKLFVVEPEAYIGSGKVT